MRKQLFKIAYLFSMNRGARKQARRVERKAKRAGHLRGKEWNPVEVS